MNDFAYRTGIGYDIHRLTEGRKLFIGGVEIPYIKGLLGHSDADALLHAICDALLGAAGAGDIGEHFPDTDQKYADISSAELLREVVNLVKAKGYHIGNVDTIVIAEEPKLLPFKKKIQDRIAEILGVEAGCVNIKAKTNEGLDEVGDKNAVACFATVLVIRDA
ncbi:MAG: 2-C-methyl-D-erythritol 2,4-cyclodiphosphate synthase [Candidatus Omnitrophota bacterium]|nr:2-C-methyl-D-erythritol 2,4-cyclodiphosphate synthase [Candidatus Omnitrophota bacterium]